MPQMKRGKMKKVFLALLLSLSFACSNEVDNNTKSVDNFDRSAMLIHWADNYILPAYQDYQQKVAVLNSSVSTFVDAPSTSQHQVLLADFVAAYKAWQWVSFLEIGPAEANTLRNFTNIYPTKPDDIEQALGNTSPNLSLPSTYNEQGFPAIDYLLNGLGEPTSTVNTFLNSPDYGWYLQALSQRLENLSTQILAEWQSSYRAEFIANTGSSATASTNKLINDFVFHFEKELRAGKVGIPAGVFSGNTLPQNVEAYYSDSLSKQLFMESLEAHTAFFKGSGFKDSQSGNSLEQYLNYLGIEDQGELLSSKINSQLEIARLQATNLDQSFANLVQNSKGDLLRLYDELQKIVVLLKVDMMQALNVRVDYIDADGD